MQRQNKAAIFGIRRLLIEMKRFTIEIAHRSSIKAFHFKLIRTSQSLRTFVKQKRKGESFGFLVKTAERTKYRHAAANQFGCPIKPKNDQNIKHLKTVAMLRISEQAIQIVCVIASRKQHSAARSGIFF